MTTNTLFMSRAIGGGAFEDDADALSAIYLVELEQDEWRWHIPLPALFDDTPQLPASLHFRFAYYGRIRLMMTRERAMIGMMIKKIPFARFSR